MNERSALLGLSLTILLASFAITTAPAASAPQGCPNATQVSRNGSGVNPQTIVQYSPPVLGQIWHVDLDCTGHANGLSYLFMYASAHPGMPTAFGELLVNTSSPRYLLQSQFHGGVVAHYLNTIPNNMALCGIRATTQGVCLGSPGARLSNALDIRFGL